MCSLPSNHLSVPTEIVRSPTNGSPIRSQAVYPSASANQLPCLLTPSQSADRLTIPPENPPILQPALSPTILNASGSLARTTEWANSRWPGWWVIVVEEDKRKQNE